MHEPFAIERRARKHAESASETIHRFENRIEDPQSLQEIKTSEQQIRTALLQDVLAATARTDGAQRIKNGAISKIKMLASRKAGEPHPFEGGAEAVARYFNVSEKCAEVARLKLKSQ